VLEYFTIGFLSKLQQQVRYEQVKTFGEMAKVAEEKEMSMKEVPRPIVQSMVKVIQFWIEPELQKHPKVNCRNPNLAKCGGEAQHLEKLGIWNPPGLPNVQSSAARPKTPRIGVFLMSLERS